MKRACQICRREGDHVVWPARERMFGLGDGCEYLECTACGCLQLARLPADWSRYYPPNYYSHMAKAVPQQGWRARLAAARDGHALTGRGWGGWLEWLAPSRLELAAVRKTGVKRSSAILDVGAGRGQLLSVLRRAGFTWLVGVDEFLPAPQEPVPGVRVENRPLAQVAGVFDLIMLHHVLEHVPDSAAMLTQCRERLAPGGHLLVRVPTVESAAWEHYRADWAQLDAPRHVVLFTHAGLDLVARRAGLAVRDWWCDSTGFQFWGSELYRRGIPLMQPDGTMVEPRRHFPRLELDRFEADARALNRVDRGDQFVALLQPIGSEPT